MKQYAMMLMMIPAVVMGCAHDEAYYRSNMTALQTAINECPDHHSGAVPCETLQQIAFRANTLADELRVDPQVFGQKILALQAVIAKEQTEALAGSDSESRHLHQIELQERLSVVKWLESPRV